MVYNHPYKHHTLLSWWKGMFHIFCNINMHIDVLRPILISWDPFSHKMEYNCVIIILEGLFRHGEVIQQRLVVTIHVCGLLDCNCHNYELLLKAMDIITGLIHCNQITTILNSLTLYLLLWDPIGLRIVEEYHQSWHWTESYIVSRVVTVNLYLYK